MPLDMTWHHVEDLPKIQEPKGHLHHQKDREKEKERQRLSLSPKPKHKHMRSPLNLQVQNAAWALEEDAGYGEAFDELNFYHPSISLFFLHHLPAYLSCCINSGQLYGRSPRKPSNLGHRSNSLSPSHHLVGSRGVVRKPRGFTSEWQLAPL